MINKYFVGIALVITGAIVFAWNYTIVLHPLITILILLIIVGALQLIKKIRRH